MKPLRCVRLFAVACVSSQAWSASLPAEDVDAKIQTVKNEQDGAEMLLIPGGRFLMGSSRDEIDAQFRDADLPDEFPVQR